jgi:signal peptide peptidase SppA, 36K type
MKKRVLAFSVFAIAAAALVHASDPSEDLKFRADDGGLWRLQDNPATNGLRKDLFAFGLQYAPVDASGSVLSSSTSGYDSLGSLDFAYALPGAYFAYNYRGKEGRLLIGSALGLSPSFAAGFCERIAFASSSVGLQGFDLGLIARPFDAISLGLTLDDAFSSSRELGMGLGLRPFAFLFEGGSWLTLTADASLSTSGFSFESVGIKNTIADTASVRLWWDFAAGKPGLELAFSVGFQGTRLSAPSVASEPANLRLGESIEIGRRQRGFLALGGKVLLFKDLAAPAASPQPENPFASLFGLPQRRDLVSIIRELDRAARDPSVVAVAFENPPSFGGLASGQDMAAAFDRLKKAGKKIYVYAEGYLDSSQFKALVARADRISLNASGYLLVEPPYSQRIYMKDFFDKLGVQFVNFAPWETKSAYNNYTASSMPEGEREMMKRLLGEIEAQTLSAIAEGRAGRLSGDPKALVAAGPYFVASDALKAGLVDAVEYRSDFEAWIKDKHKGAALDEPSFGEERGDSWGPSLAAKKVAVLYLDGDIVQGEGAAGSSIGLSAARAIEALRKDWSVKAVILRVNSPGGSALTSDVIAEEVKRTVAAGKPVVVSMGDYAASGGYYVSANASRIYAEPGTLTGSIGVTGLFFNAASAMAKLGLRPDGVGPEGKTDYFGDVFKDFDKAELAKVDAMVHSSYERFVSVVAEGRHMSPDAVKELAEGRIWTGREASSNGLVDELGDLEAVKAYVKKSLGGRVEFEDRLAGGPAGQSALGTFASSASAAYLRAHPADDAKAPSAERLALALESYFGPYASRLADLLSMGQGPLLYCDLPEVR